MKTAGIAGAGLVGRLLALELIKQGWKVTLFDQDTKDGGDSCGAVAAGMLAPLAEVETADSLIFSLGIESISIWPNILQSLIKPTHFQMSGSIIVAHSNDLQEVDRFIATARKRSPEIAEKLQFLDKDQISEFEPELNFSRGIYLPFEGNIDNSQLFTNLALTLVEEKVIWLQQTLVSAIKPYKIIESGNIYSFDLVFDCRGLGSKNDYQALRGVRGEIFLLHAPSVNFSRPIRMMHPRYPIYVVPRANNMFIVGATEIESNDFSPVSVQSCLELLSAAYSLHKGFAEARIMKMSVNCRPAFPDNLPRIYVNEGLVAINGLYRHGFLLAPALIKEVTLLIDGKKTNFPSIVEVGECKID